MRTRVPNQTAPINLSPHHIIRSTSDQITSTRWIWQLWQTSHSFFFRPLFLWLSGSEVDLTSICSCCKILTESTEPYSLECFALTREEYNSLVTYCYQNEIVLPTPWELSCAYYLALINDLGPEEYCWSISLEKVCVLLIKLPVRSEALDVSVIVCQIFIRFFEAHLLKTWIIII